jgi:NADPH:quinone reductase-like Zn-dependent oxidoreductase
MFDDNLPKLKFDQIPTRQEVLGRLKTLLESGKLTPVIGRTFPLGEVRAAMRCLIEGRTLGRIVIRP